MNLTVTVGLFILFGHHAIDAGIDWYWYVVVLVVAFLDA